MSSKIKIECQECGLIYEMFQEIKCPKCQSVRGFMANKTIETIGHRTINRNDILELASVSNKYQVKEFQAGGLIAILHSSPVAQVQALKGKKVYISHADLHLYK